MSWVVDYVTVVAVDTPHTPQPFPGYVGGFTHVPVTLRTVVGVVTLYAV